MADTASQPLAPAAMVGGDPNHPPVDKRERQGWYAYDWANSAVSSVVLSGFLPLLVQEAALAAAGFPAVCPNIVRTALVATVFAGATPMPSAMYIYNGEEQAFWPSAKCVAWAGDGNVYCPGLPSNADACLQASGAVTSPFPLRVSDSMTVWEPTAYTSAMVSVSVGIQMLLFVTMGSLSDYGTKRKHFLVSTSILGSLLCILGIGVTAETWWAGGVLMVLINVMYGVSYVFYNGWLPLLASNDPLTLAAPPSEKDGVFMARMDAISSTGMAIGYFGSVLCLVICVGVTIASDTAMAAYRINVLIAGVWWAAFSLFTFKWLRPRPGPPLPPGASYLTLPWKNLYSTLSHARELRQNFIFLLCWFTYSDGFSVISSVGSSYANAYIQWEPLNKSVGLAGLLLVVPLFAGAGNLFFAWLQRRFKLGTAQVVVINNVLMALVPAYGLLGFVNRSLGYRRWYDMYLGVILYGFNLGSVQSVSRAVYGSMIPEGQESRFYALFSFTDKGSSWIGPAVVATIIQSTGTFRLAFIYPLVALLLPLPFVLSLDFSLAEKEAKAYAARHQTSAGMATRGAMTSVGHEAQVIQEADAAEKAAAAAHPTPTLAHVLHMDSTGGDKRGGAHPTS